MTSKISLSLIASCLIANCLLSTPIEAQTPSKTKLPTWYTAHKKNIESTWDNTGSSKKANTTLREVEFVFGNDVWQAGRRYSNGNDWLALTCVANECSLLPASLKVQKKSWQGHYDEVATAGQVLNFRLSQATKAEVIAWFKRTPKSPDWLKEGSVTSFFSMYHRSIDSKRELSVETVITLPDGNSVRFVPLLDKKDGFSKAETSQAFLQLRSANKRQLLLGTLGDCTGSEALTAGGDYLLWAGDLDRDGKPDYLVSFIDADGPVHLYLSSRAKANDLVGLAGIYNSSPFGGECDGGGWGAY